MRYIRTKQHYIVDTQDMHPTTLQWYRDTKMEREADTIDELCDDFILVAPYRFRFPKTASELDKDYDEMRYFYSDKDDHIFGAIWDIGTHGEPILKSVAKRNDEGELELL